MHRALSSCHRRNSLCVCAVAGVLMRGIVLLTTNLMSLTTQALAVGAPLLVRAQGVHTTGGASTATGSV